MRNKLLAIGYGLLAMSMLSVAQDNIIDEVDSGEKNYPTSVYYMDIMSEYERMGDFMINISQNLEKAFITK